MQKFKILIVFLAIAGLGSCKKATERGLTQEQILSVATGADSTEEGSYRIDSYIILKSSYHENAADTNSYRIELLGKIIEDTVTKRLLSVGSLSVDGRTPINQSSDGSYYYNYTDNDPDGGKGLFGKEISFDAGGSSDIEGHRRTMYVPNQLFTNNFLNYGMRSHISKSQNYPINWYSDPNNPFGKVLIQVTYHPSISRIDFAGAPSSMPLHKYEVADNGSFYIPASHLAGYPVGSVISISLSRANYTDYYANNVRRTKIVYITVVESRTIPLYVTP